MRFIGTIVLATLLLVVALPSPAAAADIPPHCTQQTYDDVPATRVTLYYGTHEYCYGIEADLCAPQFVTGESGVHWACHPFVSFLP